MANPNRVVMSDQIKLPKYGTEAWKALVVKAAAKEPAKRTAREREALRIEVRTCWNGPYPDDPEPAKNQ